ncbi:MAG: hypothetical protein MSD82_04395, partial [Prevotella sp.]|nr:hypothetical protein [Prevotella sp.]
IYIIGAIITMTISSCAVSVISRQCHSAAWLAHRFCPLRADTQTRPYGSWGITGGVLDSVK